jgi:hypothetical protein
MATAGKKAKNVALVAGTQQTLSNLFFLSISMLQTWLNQNKTFP